MKIKGKCVLITGSAKRGGAELVKTFASAGARVILHCNNSVNDAELLLPTLPGTGHRIIRADFAEMAEVERLISEAGTFDILINNASIFFRPGSPEDAAAAKLYDRINFQVPKRLLEIFYQMSPPDGAVVNITDCMSLVPGQGSYWQSKKDLTELTIALAVPWAERKLRINAIAPGAVLPPSWALDSAMSKILAATPLHRSTAPGDIAELTGFLLTCPSITGTVIPLDGALHLKK